MKNDLTKLPWASDQFYMAENYWEVSGILNSIKGGIDPKTVRRPLDSVKIHAEDIVPSKIESSILESDRSLKSNREDTR